LSPSRLRHIIAWIQIAGAAWGAPATYIFLTHPTGQVGGLFAAFSLFFTLIGLAGILLLRNHPWGVPLSLIVQGMQLPVILSPGASYYANAGLGLRVTMDTAWNFGFYAHLGTQLHYSWESDRTTTALGINLVAAALLYLLVMRVEEPVASRDAEASDGAPDTGGNRT
jgi:hypothetical protein